MLGEIGVGQVVGIQVMGQMHSERADPKADAGTAEVHITPTSAPRVKARAQAAKAKAAERRTAREARELRVVRRLEMVPKVGAGTVAALTTPPIAPKARPRARECLHLASTPIPTRTGQLHGPRDLQRVGRQDRSGPTMLGTYVP